jgi:hypothetical protein
MANLRIWKTPQEEWARAMASHDERLHSDESRKILTDLMFELRRLEEQDVSEPCGPLRPNLLKSSPGLYYHPEPHLIEFGIDKRIADRGGEFHVEPGFTRRGVEEFLRSVITTLPSFARANKFFAEAMTGSENDHYAAELYLTMFCYRQLVARDSVSFQSEIDKFLECLEKDGFTLSFRIGLDGIQIADKSIILHDTPEERVIIRQPEPSDQAIPILVTEPWDPGANVVELNRPSLPSFSSVIVVGIKRPIFNPTNLGWFEIRFRSRIRTLDWLLESMRIRVNELSTILTTFQAKTIPRFPYLQIQFFGTTFSEEKPIYETTMPWQPLSKQAASFAITTQNALSFQRFCKRMTERKILDRIYGAPKNSPWDRVSSPLREAFEEYQRILSSNMDPRERALFTILAIEALYAYKEESKLFIRMFPELERLTGVRDPNNSRLVLTRAWKIRSEGVHRGAGWDALEARTAVSSDSSSGQGLDYETAKKLHEEDQVSSLTLNYLRISIMSRIIARCNDREFLENLETERGKAFLASELKGMSDFVLGDPPLDASLEPEAHEVRVFVDAKILGQHDPNLPKRTLIGYVVNDMSGESLVTDGKSTETDDAELEAIAFAIGRLKNRIPKFTVVCDHESVVSIITRKHLRPGIKKPILLEIRDELRNNSSIQVDALGKNPAHQILNRYLGRNRNIVSG